MRSSRTGFALILFAFVPAAVVAACDGDRDTTPTSGSSSVATTGTGGNGGSGGSGGSGGTKAPLPTANCEAAEGLMPGLQLTSTVTGLDFPVMIQWAPGDAERMFIVERKGKIKIQQEGAISTFLDIESLVASSDSQGDERGLLGLAFHPEYAKNGRFFVHFSNAQSGGDTKVAEYKVSPDPGLADATEVATILTIDQPQGNHNGGSISFSPVDGFLYIGIGDGGGGGDDDEGHTGFGTGTIIGNGQDTSNLLGAMLRLDVDSATKPYGIPPGNLTGGTARPEIWDYGLRNPYRFSFDDCNGNLYIGDVGQGAVEEIDVAAAGDGNKNWGWRPVEGNLCYPDPGSGCDMTGLEPPAATYPHSGLGGCSVTGGYVYRGSAIPALRGAYFYGDYCSSRIWMFRWDAGNVSDAALMNIDGSAGRDIVSFGQDLAGELYLVHLGGGPGQGIIYRIEAKP